MSLFFNSFIFYNFQVPNENDHISLNNIKIKNNGWSFETLQDNDNVPESIQIRGYTINKVEECTIIKGVTSRDAVRNNNSCIEDTVYDGKINVTV
jgi:hypothetical protein